MVRQVSAEEFFEKIGPLNVTLEVKEAEFQFPSSLTFAYKTLYRLKNSGKLVGYDEHEKYYLFE